MEPMSTKETGLQFKVPISKEMRERLDDAARKYRRDSGNKLAAEIISTYFDHWEDAERARQAIIEQQRASALQGTEQLAHVFNPAVYAQGGQSQTLPYHSDPDWEKKRRPGSRMSKAAKKDLEDALADARQRTRKKKERGEKPPSGNRG